MYRIGIIINENEASHSKYADTLSTLTSAINESNDSGSKGNSYHFVVFDRFNVEDLFVSHENNIMTFHGIVIATNAMSFTNKLFRTFSENRHKIEEYLDHNKGIFISSQKKLSNGALSTAEFRSVGFLPDIYDFYMFYRPEKYSSIGTISVSDVDSNVLHYPYEITKDVIDHRCENNEFMVHRYRSVIIPKNINAYDTLLVDKESLPITHARLGYIDGDRKLVLSSRYNKRIVISTMSLDWANHAEILCNILTYITKDQPLTFFVKKESERNISDAIIDSYIIRANIINIPYRVIVKEEIDSYIENSQDRFIFSPNWSSQEIKEIYEQMLNMRDQYFSIYHIHELDTSEESRLALRKYSNFSSVDIMKDETVANLIGSYVRNSWGKSIWTYSYIINLIEFFDLDLLIIFRKVYDEISRHFTKKDETLGVVELIGNYDNVFNNTCKMLEIFHYFQSKYGTAIDQNSQYKLNDVTDLADQWMIEKIQKSTVYDQDICYYLLYLVKCDKINVLDGQTKKKALDLFNKLLASILEEILSTRIQTRSSVDLSRIYLTLCLLEGKQVLKASDIKTYIEQLEKILNERQDLYGIWKNISETAEITGMLLEAYEARLSLDIPSDRIKILISRGIEALYLEYNSITKMWAGDLNTTAKAMFAIGLYDRKFNFSINDFFFELKGRADEKVTSVKDYGPDYYYDFYRMIDELENKNESLSMTVFESEANTAELKNILGETHKRSSILLAMSIFLAITLLLIVSVLYASHRDALIDIFGNWREPIIGGFIGLVITVIVTFIYDRLQKRQLLT